MAKITAVIFLQYMPLDGKEVDKGPKERLVDKNHGWFKCGSLAGH
jgi:hypothetical protein